MDSAQIEARVLAWMANQIDLVEGFANGEDIYSVFATKLFGSAVYKPKEDEIPAIKRLLKIRRGFGKDSILGCVAFGTPILTDTGWRPIEKIHTGNRLWDGRRWVRHQGVIYKGKKPCVNVNDVWMTPDHEVFDRGVWFPARSLSTCSRGFATNLENLQSLQLSTGHAEALSPSNVVAPVVELLLRTETIWSQENLHGVMSVLKRHPVKLRLISRQLQSHIVLDFLTAFVQSLADVKPDRIDAMGYEVLECGPLGSQIEYLFLITWSLYQDGIIRNLTLTDSTMTMDMNLVISDSAPGAKTLETADILNAGEYHRFQAGNMIVANCGYGMGAPRFFNNCLSNCDLRPMFDDGTYNKQFIEKLIKTYRTTYYNIPQFWTDLEKAFKWVIKYPHDQTKVSKKYGADGKADGFRLLLFNRNGTVHIRLPSGRELTYRHCTLKKGAYGSDEIRWHYGHLWGGSICLAGHTRVLTDSGWVRLDRVRKTDKVWDGALWVQHGGCVCKGEKRVLGLNGIDLTENHKIKTTEGWTHAKEALGLTWENVWIPDCHRESRIERELRAKQLPLGNTETASQQQENDTISRTRPRSIVTPVYDLIDCGSKNCFTVLDESGEPRLVHNCENVIQAIARDLLIWWILEMERHGLTTVLDVHDEIVCMLLEATAEQSLQLMVTIMCTNPDWAEGLPLDAEGELSLRYKK